MHRWRVAATGSSGEDVESLTAVFAAEVAKRQAAEAAAAEAAAAREFDGAALLALVQKKYGRSYDFSLVQVRLCSSGISWEGKWKLLAHAFACR